MFLTKEYYNKYTQKKKHNKSNDAWRAKNMEESFKREVKGSG